MFVFFENTTNINAKNAVKVLCNFPTPVIPTEDARLLAKLCTMGVSEGLNTDVSGKIRSFNSSCDADPFSVCDKDQPQTTPTTRRTSTDVADELSMAGMGSYLKQIRESGEFETMEDAAPALVDLALREKLAGPEDCPMLLEKFSVWLRDRSWADCDVNDEDSTVPPWSYSSYLYSSLTWDLIGENVGVVFKNDKPVDLVGSDHEDLFQLLWSFRGGVSPDVEESTITAMTIGFEYNQQIIARERRMKLSKAKSMHSRKRANDPAVCNCTVS